MSARFEELDWRPTRLGDISLRRRWDPAFKKEVYEVKLDDDFLMSSLFPVAEIELAKLALANLADLADHTDQADPAGQANHANPAGEGLDVVVGGLGLGYTAQTVLESPRVCSMLVAEALGEVIEWHERGLIPAGKALTADPRCRYVHGDFFAMAASPDGLDPEQPGRRFDAIIVDIDHSPRHLLHASHAAFYEVAGMRRLAAHLRPGGVFALWSNDPPDAEYTASLADVFDDVRATVVSFGNPLQGRDATNTVYLARARPAS